MHKTYDEQHPIVSIDALTITARLDKEQFDEWYRDHYHQTKTSNVPKNRGRYNLYQSAFIYSDAHICLNKTLGIHHDIRISFNPSRRRSNSTGMTLLMECLRDVKLNRVDIALDYFGVRIHDYQFLVPKARKKVTSTGLGPVESIEFGTPRSNLQIMAYDKKRQSRKGSYDIVTIDGEIISPPTKEEWLRVEACQRSGSVLSPQTFGKLHVLRKGFFEPPQGMTQRMTKLLTEASSSICMLDGAYTNTRSREVQLKKLFAGVAPIESHPNIVYESRLADIKTYIRIFQLGDIESQYLSKQTREILTVAC